MIYYSPDLRKIAFLILVITAELISFMQPAFGQVDEYLVKAVWFEKFTRFIEWPPESNVNDAEKPFIIGVIGKNPFENTLEKIYATQKIKNKNVEIIKISGISQISQVENCSLLFISQSEKDNIPKIVSTLKDKPVLLISDVDGAAARGVHINFYTSQSKILFEINESASRNARFYISFRLLNVARLVEPIKGQ